MMQGQVVLMTGAARGIGRYVAGTFADVGAKLALADILPVDETAAQVRERGAETLPLSVDVANEEAVKRMVDSTIERFGRIDVLVNIAGIPTHASWEPHWPRIHDMDKSFWDKIMDTNLGGTFLCTKHVLPHMERQRSGHVLNTSGGGRPVPHGACVYVVSKDAVRTFTRFVAEEEREHNVCVVAVAPGGAIATEAAPEEVRRELPGVELVSNRYVLAAQAGLDLAGKELTLVDGKLTVEA
jgi:NAD(P)-dependent dehydrogenase (short-subunit alcohol dehydrogenase family)